MCAHIPAKLQFNGSPPAGMFAKDKVELLPVQKMTPMNLSLEMLWVVHLIQIYRAHWTQSTQPAWPEEKLVGAHSLYITFCFCILPPISYTAGQAKKHVDVQQELLNFCASEPKNKKGKPQENTKLHFNLDFSSDQIKKHPLLLPQHGF